MTTAPKSDLWTRIGSAIILFAIGLALGHVRTQDGLTGIVPPRVMAHLLVHIERGDPACEVVMDWLAKRSRNANMQIQRRKVRERPRPEPGNLRKRAFRKRNLVGSDLAIIAGWPIFWA